MRPLTLEVERLRIVLPEGGEIDPAALAEGLEQEIGHQLRGVGLARLGPGTLRIRRVELGSAKAGHLDERGIARHVAGRLAAWLGDLSCIGSTEGDSGI